MTQDKLGQEVWKILAEIQDPELNVSIVDLGLIYHIEIWSGNVLVQMTLTSPGCPLSGTISRAVEYKISQIKGVTSVNVEFVWDPPWNPSMVSDGISL
jgi:metal-sulfur cluster biosynthetic enzyme